MESIYSLNGLNQNLENKLRSIITYDKYKDFTALIIEILLRRQEEFGLSESRLMYEARNLVKRLPGIEIVHSSELAHPQAVAQSSIEGIKISYEYFSEVLSGNKYLAEYLYETLTHEIYHSIALNDYGETGVFNFGFESRGLNELINEAAANRASNNYTSYERQTGIRRTGSYRDLTLLSPLLARSFGVTEREFLSSGINENGEYDLLRIATQNAMTSDVDKNAEYCKNIKNLITAISYQIDMLHNIEMPMDKSQIIPEEQKSSYRTEILKKIIGACINLVSYRLENDARYPSREMVEDYAYSYKGIAGFVNNILEQYKNMGLINDNQINEIKRENEPQILQLCDRILGLNEVTKVAFSGKSQKTVNEMIFLAKKGYLMSIPQIAHDYGVTIPQDKYRAIWSIDTTRRHNQIVQEDFRNRKWNNEPVITMTKQVFRASSKKLREIDSFWIMAPTTLSLVPNYQSEIQPEKKESLLDKMKKFFDRIRTKKLMPGKNENMSNSIPENIMSNDTEIAKRIEQYTKLINEPSSYYKNLVQRQSGDENLDKMKDAEILKIILEAQKYADNQNRGNWRTQMSDFENREN